jgi:membrane fusion protein
MTSIFRPEAIRAHASADAMLGTPLDARVPGLGGVAALALATLATLFLLFGFVSYHQTAKVAGIVAAQGGEIRLPSPMAGTVSRVHVAQGDAVAAGAVLFEVTPEYLSQSASSARALGAQALRSELTALRTAHALEREQLERSERDLAQRAALLASDLDSLRSEQALAAAQRELAAQESERATRSQSLGLISAQRLSEIQRVALDADIALGRIERARRASERERDDALGALAEMPARRAMLDATLKSREAALTVQIGELGSESLEQVTAPIAGVVFSVDVQAGQSVAHGQALGRMARDGTRLVAELVAPTSAPGQIRVGADVVVRAPSFPYQRFGHLRAKVTSISGMPSATCADAPALEAACGYRVLAELERDQVEIAGQWHRLRPGMRLEADIVLQRRRLWEWFAEPLLAARATLGEP